MITALNEEAVASAALANKGGINIIVTYEAFGAKMHGEVRQEIVFANHQKEAGKPPRWLSVPLVLTSHAWENAKNEQSHQDPAMAEAMLGEPFDVSGFSSRRTTIVLPPSSTASTRLRVKSGRSSSPRVRSRGSSHPTRRRGSSGTVPCASTGQVTTQRMPDLC